MKIIDKIKLMNEKHRQIKSQKKEYLCKINGLSEKLCKANIDEIKKDISWLETYDTIKKIKIKQRYSFFSTILIPFICITIIGIGWGIPIPSAWVKMEILADNIAVKLKDSWSMDQAITIDNLYLTNIAAMSFPGHDIEINNESSDLELQCTKCSLNELNLDKDSEIDFSLDFNDLSLNIKNGEINGQFYIEEATLIISSSEKRNTITIKEVIPETLFFTAKSNEVLPVMLQFSGKNSFTLPCINTNSLHFDKEYPPASGQFKSAIISGKIYIADTDYAFELYEGDSLDTGKVETRYLSLNRQPDSLKLSFEGSIGNLSAGAQFMKKSYMPNLIEYIYKNSKLLFLWGAFTFLWGILWGIRNFFMNKDK